MTNLYEGAVKETDVSIIPIAKQRMCTHVCSENGRPWNFSEM